MKFPSVATLRLLVARASRPCFFFAVLISILSITSNLGAQATKPASPSAPNLIVTFTSGKSFPDSRLSRLPDVFVEAGQSPTVFDAPGPFKATFTGDLSLRIRDTLKFTFAGRGAVKLSINNSVVLENSGDDLSNKTSDDVKLLKGKNAFQLEYTSPPSGNAELRTYWLSKDFSAEPIPPTQFTHNPEDKALIGGTRLRNGRMLFATLRCNKCHTGPELKDAVMPELESDAPNLTEVGARLNPAWIAAWVKNPKSQRPTATMPRVITGSANEGADVEIANIAAYLGTLGTPVEVNIPSDDQTISAGGHLFTALGCIACHLAPDSKVDDPTRIPLSVAKLKYRPAALKAFLLAPEKNYAWIRMPNFRLSDTEATAITAYLLANGPVKLPAIKGNPEAGKLSFTSAGCLNCHTAGDAKPAHRDVASLTVAMQNSFRGCLAATPQERRAAPDFGFSMQDRIDVTTFYTQYLDTLKREDPADLAERQVAALNCLACHTRDKAGDPWAGLVDEVEAIENSLPPLPEDPNAEKFAPDQSRPNLNWVGEKLYPEWMEQFISGRMDFKPRPYLRARMPGFVNRAKFIAPGFAAEHGYPAKSAAPAPPDSSLIPIGQKLAGKSGGFGCVSCHAVAGAPALAAFEAPAPNFAFVKERIRKDYYTRWTRNPQRVEPGTRMPSFADYEGKTAIQDPYDGDSKQQFEAIWNYLQQGRQITPPG